MPILLSIYPGNWLLEACFPLLDFLVNSLPFDTANSHNHYVCAGHMSESEPLAPEAESSIVDEASRVGEDELPMLDEILSVEPGISTSQPDAVKNNDGQQQEVNYF